MVFRHGIYITESPTSIVAPKESGTNTVAIGIAPINLAAPEDRKVNVPVLAMSEGDVHKYLGKSKYTEEYNLSEVSDCFFKYFGVAPVIFINVLDPQKHKTSIADETILFIADKGTLQSKGVLNETLILKSDDGATTYEEGKDYVVAFSEEEETLVTLLEGSAIQNQAIANYDIIDPSLVTPEDMIGGEDASGVRTGMEVISDVYSTTFLVPRQLIHPGWHDSAVIAVGKVKMETVLNTCQGMQWVDIDTTVAKSYTEAPTWKKDNNIVGINQIVCWPMATLGDFKFHLSTQGAALKAQVDSNNDNVPSESPSNKPLQIDGAILKDGTEVILDQGRANYLNGNGIVTIESLKLWGNYTAAYTETTDVKDTFIPVRDMFNWAGVSINLTYADKIDKPGNLNLIETITDSQNIWLNGLTADQHIYGGRVLFRQEDNPITNLLGGKFTYKLYMSPVVPHQEMVEDMEYDPTYMETLFG